MRIYHEGKNTCRLTYRLPLNRSYGATLTPDTMLRCIGGQFSNGVTPLSVTIYFLLGDFVPSGDSMIG